MYKQYKKGIEEFEGRFLEADIKLLDLGGFTSKQVQDFIKDLLKQHTINLIDSEIGELEKSIKTAVVSKNNPTAEDVYAERYHNQALQDQITRLQQEKEKIINDNK